MFRIVLDLSYFFQNHKRKARVFVKENIKTVADLQKRITEIFGVKNFELYVFEGQCFLPSQEDIRVLRDDEVVSVVPTNQTKPLEELVENSSVVLEKPKKSKRSLEVILEENPDDVPSPRKKKVKESDVQESTSEEELTRKKKKRKHSKRNTVEIISEGYNSQKKSKFGETNPHPPSSLPERSKTTEKPKSLISLLPTLKSHINSCDTTGRPVPCSATSTSVRLAHHIDTPYKKFKKLEPIPTITDEVLNKKKINIVKIDIIKQGAEVLINEKNDVSINRKEIPENLGENSHAKNLSFSTPKSNFVKKVVKYIEKEKSLSPENELFNKNTDKSSNCVMDKFENIEPIRNSSFQIENNITIGGELDVGHGMSNKCKFLENNCNITTGSELMELDYDMSNDIVKEDLDPIRNSNCFSLDGEKYHSKRVLDNSEQTRTSVWSNLLNNTDKSLQDTTGHQINVTKSPQTETNSDNKSKSEIFSVADKSRNSFDSSLLELTRNEPKISVGEKTVMDLDSSFQLAVISKLNESLNNSRGSKAKISEPGDTSVNLNSSACNSFDTYNKSTQNKILDNSLQSELKTSLNATNESVNNLSSDIVNTPPFLLRSNEDSNKSGTPLESKNFFYMKRKLAGVAACLGQLRESDVASAEPDTSSIKDLSTNSFVTKRQRKRVRHRRSKKSRDRSDASNSDTSFVMESYVPKPLNVSGCPKIHVKFTSDDEADAPSKENKSEQIRHSEQTEAGKLQERCQIVEPKNEQNSVNQQNDTKEALNGCQHALFSEDTIVKSPIMLSSEPKEGNIIAFKTLIMKGFSPVISDYIVGRVLEFSEEKVVQFEMLSQIADDFQNEEENSNLRRYPWQKLIAPRLIFP